MSSSFQLPSKMKAVLLQTYTKDPNALTLAELPLPTLKKGQVLIKMAAASINPSDLSFLKGQYGITKPLPVVPGFEGSGLVIASGGGWLAHSQVGKRVACKAPEDSHGTWAEYMAANAKECIPLFKKTTFEQGAALIVNPMTAMALIDIALNAGTSAYVQTAAAGALGLMIARLGKRRQLIGIHVVHRKEQVEKMKAQGIDYVFDSNDPLFSERLSEACHKFQARIAFDAVGGALTAQLASALPAHSRVLMYGALSMEICQISPLDIVFHDEKLEGFWLSDWIKHKNFLQKMLFAMSVQQRLSDDLQTHIQARFPLEQFREAIDLYKKKRTDGKVLFVPTPRNSITPPLVIWG
jgi:NADPH2:quinone reductase